jgi:hypothetical protein
LSEAFKNVMDMKEQEYIDVKELGIVKSAKEVLGQITPEVSKVVPVSQFNDIMKMLCHWESKLHDRIDITES